jgi:hypothetical protein
MDAKTVIPLVEKKGVEKRRVIQALPLVKTPQTKGLSRAI